MEKQRLEKLLELIKEEKEEKLFLVGTRDILKTIKYIEGIYENPKKLADKINNDLQILYKNPSYLATPERLNGLDNLYRDIIPDKIEEENKNIDDYLKDLGVFLWSSKNISIFSNNINENISYFQPFFNRANIEKITRNDEIPFVINQLLIEQYQTVKEKIPEHLIDEIDSIVNRSIIRLNYLNWDKLISLENLSKNELDYRKFIYEFNIPYQDFIDRAINEQIENKLEIRRKILEYFIEKYSENCEDFGWIFKMEKTWKSIVELTDSNIRKFSSEEDKKMDLERAIYLRRLLGQEQNFVEKMLSN